MRTFKGSQAEKRSGLAAERFEGKDADRRRAARKGGNYDRTKADFDNNCAKPRDR